MIVINNRPSAKFGLEGLDEFVKIKPGQLCVLIGGRGTGKTTLSLQLFRNWKKVGFYHSSCKFLQKQEFLGCNFYKTRNLNESDINEIKEMTPKPLVIVDEKFAYIDYYRELAKSLKIMIVTSRLPNLSNTPFHIDYNADIVLRLSTEAGGGDITVTIDKNDIGVGKSFKYKCTGLFKLEKMCS